MADIQKKHPHDLFNLLTRVSPFLKSKSWDTRVAAAKAIAGIVENSRPYDPNQDEDQDTLAPATAKTDTEPLTIKAEEEDSSAELDHLQLETLDVAAILANGKKLLGSAGKEYDYFLLAMDPVQRLAHQKKNLTARLGLGGEYTEEELINDGDFRPPILRVDSSVLSEHQPHSPAHGRPASIQSPHDQHPAQGEEMTGLSKRQLNMLKRKSKKEFKSQAGKVGLLDLSQRRTSSQDLRPALSHQESSPVKCEIPPDSSNDSKHLFTLDRQTGDDETKMVSEFKGQVELPKSELVPDADEEGLEWPFERLCEFLMIDVFSHNWEHRHGAAMGLRDIVRVHGLGAGRRRGKTRLENDALNQHWLNDLACRLCCIFMLDRFGDYVSDNVVAPIRETAGQALGALLQYMSPEMVNATFRVLHGLVMQNNTGAEKRVWQACHGGMIGMRYLVAVRSDLLAKDKLLMQGVLEAVMRGLSDFDDDVRAVSAATLLPVAQDFVEMHPAALSDLITIVWGCLSDLSDDLSASTGFIMDLLAKLCSFSQVLDTMKLNAVKDASQSFANLVPRLYPFLRHTITSVRSAVLRALLQFLDIEGDGTRDWVDGKTLRLIFQNLLVERSEPVLKLSMEVWNALVVKTLVLENDGTRLAMLLSPHLDPLIALTLHPIGVQRNPIPMNLSLLIRASGQVFTLPSYASSRSPPGSASASASEPPAKRRRKVEKQDTEPQPISAHNIDGPMIQGDVDLVGMEVLIRSKLYAAEALALAMSMWPVEHRQQDFGSRILDQFTSPYASTQLAACLIARQYALHAGSRDSLAYSFVTILQNIVDGDRPACYAELVGFMLTARDLCSALLSTFRTISPMITSKLPVIAAKVQGEQDWGPHAFSIEHAEKTIGADFVRLKQSLTPSQRISGTQSLTAAKLDVERAVEDAKNAKEVRDTRIRATAASGVAIFKAISKKPQTTIKAMMDSVKSEENIELQKISAGGVVSLIRQFVTTRKIIVEKVVGNLVKFYCTDTAETPEFHINASNETGVLSLKKDEDVRDHADPAKHERDAKAARIMRRGARETLEQLSAQCRGELFSEVPVLLNLIKDPLKLAFAGDLPANINQEDITTGQEAVDGLSTLRALVGRLDPTLHSVVLDLVPYVVKALTCKLSVLRYAAAKCFATICSVIPAHGFSTLVQQILPSINNAHNVACRQGVVECIYHIVHAMEDRILPYVIFLIVPVLGRMSDADGETRLIATTTFATLVKLVPLEAGIPDPPGFSEELLQGRERERKFMAQMLDTKKVEPFEIPVAIKATLRSYQQEGVNWLAFLNRYHLHGILCDDMGLGKTLQTLCIVASDHYMRAAEFSKTQNPDARKLPSLIVCPPTLSGHWQHEIRHYAPFLTAVAYVGPPGERARFRSKLDTADVVITSYEICRNDIDILALTSWNYCVLDEGHLIKNPAAKTSIAVKRLASNHRLILSGTPIQNNVLELWSLFDFLMPGFLGTEKLFKDRFAKPIAASRYGKSSSKEQEAGALAIEALHKQVLPFLLRRLKEEVLDDLPPKIIQNYYCDLSDLQKKLFDDFTRKEGKALTEMAQSGDREAKQHIFTALNYMRKLCNSPALVIKESHKQFADVQKFLAKTKTSLHDAVHAPKLAALRDLLVDCGIGASDVVAAGTGQGHGQGHETIPVEAVSQHRALIFCQMKEMLDIVQNDVLKAMLPSVTFLRLDGGVEASKRQDVVDAFNGDPSIDVLLLTTTVGGLGLNLTGADTVIFVEHDWNPQKDMQAMDRAHRIGQRRTVNVYRLVTRATLEEKILNLQRFKLDVASTVVNQQNAGLATMQTDQILDLFSLGEPGDVAVDAGAGGEDAEEMLDEVGEVRDARGGADKGQKGFLKDLGELWDERAYEEEFDLGDFLGKMKA